MHQNKVTTYLDQSFSNFAPEEPLGCFHTAPLKKCIKDAYEFLVHFLGAWLLAWTWETWTFYKKKHKNATAVHFVCIFEGILFQFNGELPFWWGFEKPTKMGAPHLLLLL